MERQVIFRDYQEQQGQDFTDMQDDVRQSFDHISKDVATGGNRRFSGFYTQKTAQVEVQTALGRFYDADGAVYYINSTTTQSMVSALAAASKRYVALSVSGTEVESDVEERDFLVDADTGATEPRAVSTTKARTAVLSFTNGAESADPQPPAIPANHVRIANILLDTVQVVSVTMITDNQIASTTELDQRMNVVEDFDARIGPRVDSLASDLADLANLIRNAPKRFDLAEVFLDLARVKAKLRFPDDASNYGADFFLNQTRSDIADSFAQGYDAKVEEGFRFPDANADEFEIDLFSQNDPNAALSNGILLPKHTDELKMQTGVLTTDLGMAQYGFQTVEMKQGYMSRSRLRYGGSYTKCSNGSEWNTEGEYVNYSNLFDYTSTEFTAVSSITYYDANRTNYESYRANTWWYDQWKEPYMYAVTTDHVLNGAMVAQSWLQSNDYWLTKIGVYISVKAATEDIHIAICEVNDGVPNLDKVVMKIVHSQANIVIGWNDIATPYTFLQKGHRYAVVLITNANHKVGMADGAGFLNGTFFYSTDGAFFQGDLTKDMMLRLYGAKFSSPQVTIEFEPINLDGGFRNIDILAESFIPESCQLIYEMRPSGSGDWLPLINDNGAVLASAPALAQFRGRFVGTVDVSPGLKLTGSRVHVARPKVAAKHVSTDVTLSVASAEIHVICILENFDETPHDHTCILKTGAGHTVTENPDTTVTTLLSAMDKRYRREYTFNLAGGSVTHFIMIQTMATTSPQNTCHIAERDFYSV